VNESLLFNAIHEACAEHQSPQGVASLADYFRKREEARSSRVLLAEDNEVNQNVLSSILERAGHSVEIAPDGEKALDILTGRDNDFDIVVLDMNMPNISGLDVLKAYRFMDTSMKLPVVMLSANALPETIEACRQAGAHDYLTKPVDAMRLVETIDRLTQPLTETRNGLADIEQFPAAKTAGAQSWHYLDTQTLENVQEISSNPESFQSLCRQFIDYGTQQLAALRDSSSSNDQDAFLAVLHDLKGSAGTLGAESLRKISAEAEGRPQQALDHASMTLLTDRLTMVFQGTCLELERYLKLNSH
jgi:two-component system sensor histidine kinase RpfC